MEDRWIKPLGVFSERDFINAVARDGAAVLGFEVQQLMSTPMLTCRSADRVDAVLATMTMARIRHSLDSRDGSQERRRVSPHFRASPLRVRRGHRANPFVRKTRST